MSKIVTCEQVSRAHVDKICDQISDAVVADCLRNDPDSRVAVETLFKNKSMIIAGEITSKHEPNYAKLVGEELDRIGIGWMYDKLKVYTLITRQSPDIALGVDKGGAGDQGVVYGYATNETPELLPIPFAVATRFMELLSTTKAPMLLPDAKAQVSYDYDSGRITTMLCSVQHTPCTDVDDFRPLVEGAMGLAAAEYGLNSDFEKLVNPTGRFVVGGSRADCGVTGRKLACDTYGGVSKISGALCGKDPTKIDRSGAYMARKIAVDLVEADFCDKCEVQIAYAIGRAEPVAVSVETFGTAHCRPECIDKYVKENYDLSPRGIIERLHLLDVDLRDTSYGGHFGKSWLPWEVYDEPADDKRHRAGYHE